MTRKVLLAAAVVAIVLVPSIGSRTAEARGGGFGAGGFHGGGFHDRGFFGGRGIRGNRFGFGGFFGGYYPGYSGNRPCYLTVYGTTYSY